MPSRPGNRVLSGLTGLQLSCAILAVLVSTPVLANQHDHALIQALGQATRDPHEQTHDLDALLWLATMSERLEKRIKDPFYRVRLLKAVYREAEITGLDPQLVLAVIEVESNFDRHALSSAGAQGLMQVMPFWKDVYETPDDDLFNPLTSLRYGCQILRHYLDLHDNQHDALAAYNGSLGRDKYPNKVLSALQRRWQYDLDEYSSPERNVAFDNDPVSAQPGLLGPTSP